MDITKKEFIQQLVDKHRYTKDSATQLVEDFWDVLNDNVLSGNSVSFYGYGCFDIIMRKERRGVNPSTGDRCIIPEHWVPRFFPGKILRRSAKLWADSDKRGLS